MATGQLRDRPGTWVATGQGLGLRAGDGLAWP